MRTLGAVAKFVAPLKVNAQRSFLFGTPAIIDLNRDVHERIIVDTEHKVTSPKIAGRRRASSNRTGALCGRCSGREGQKRNPHASTTGQNKRSSPTHRCQQLGARWIPEPAAKSRRKGLYPGKTCAVLLRGRLKYQPFQVPLGSICWRGSWGESSVADWSLASVC